MLGEGGWGGEGRLGLQSPSASGTAMGSTPHRFQHANFNAPRIDGDVDDGKDTKNGCGERHPGQHKLV